MIERKRWFILIALVISVIFMCHANSGKAATLEWSGEVKVNLGVTDRGDDGGSSSGIMLDEVVLNLEADVVENVNATAVIKYEEEELFLDEGYLTLTQFVNQPMKLLAGKRVLPFGVFNSHLITDPLTQDKYEINAPGLTLAFSQEALQGLEFSLSVYSDPNGDDDLGDFILNVTMAPTDLVNFSVYFDSAQGVDRNNTAGVSLGVVVENLTVDFEYITALERDADAKETAFSLAGAYQLLPTFEVALRYEGYDDDTGVDEKFNEETLEGLESRLSAGINYELYEHTNLGAEFRMSSYELTDDTNEWGVQLSVEF
ncbi:MAG: hypothetical protein ACMUIA_00565 [bacterium]